jgi:hypothetical protein
MQSVIMHSVIMQSVIMQCHYAVYCHFVEFKNAMRSVVAQIVIILSVIMLSVALFIVMRSVTG